MRPYGKAWFRVNRPTLVDEDIRVSRLHAPQQAWWLEIPVRLLESHQHTNLLCENGENIGREFFHLRVPIAYIAKHRHSLDLRLDKDPHKFALHLSARQDDLFRDKRGVGEVDFSQFVMPKDGKCVVQEAVHRDNASHGDYAYRPTRRAQPAKEQPVKKIHVFIDAENNLAKEDAYDILEWLSKNFNHRVEGKAFTAKREAGAFRTWNSLFQKYNIEIERASPTGKDAADAKLLEVFTLTTSRMQSGGYVCIVGSDQIYSQAVASALPKGINVWHFCKRMPKWNPGDKKYRICIIGKPDNWKM